ncbi:MAG: CPBP family intramembrane metalloprotease [Armatimonadetes bacterium]|nr:CPBP family intramembrane metalloprotease [Armatimonadota bacterium]
MQPPVFELSPPAPPLIQNEPRRPIVWAVLAFIFALLIVGQLYDYFSPNRAATKRWKEESSFETQLKIAVATGQVMPIFPGVGTRKPFDDIKKDIDRTSGPEAEVARYRAVIDFEATGKASQADLKTLNASDNFRDRQFALVYSEPMTKGEAERLQRVLTSDKMVDRLAVAHAFLRAGDRTLRNNVIPNDQAVGLLFGLGMSVVVEFLGVIALIVALVFVAKPLPDTPFGRPVNGANADRLAMRALQLLLVFLIVSLIPPFKAIWMTLLLRSVLLGIAPFVLIKTPLWGKTDQFSDYGIHLKDGVRNVGLGLWGWIAVQPIILLVEGVSLKVFTKLPAPEHPISVELASKPSIMLLVSLFVAAAIQAPLFEEVMFRASLSPALQGLLKSRALGVVVSSLIFASIHPTGIPAWPGLACIGAASAYLTYRSQSLIPSFVLHAVHNGATLLLAYLITG